MTWNLDKALETPAKRVRGLGSAREGAGRWWMERLTALALIPLILWFVISIMHLAVNGGQSIGSWFSNPLHALFSIVMFSVMFYHTKLGVQVVIEDYMHYPALKTAMLILNNIVFLVAGFATILAVAKLHLSNMSAIA
ncbi:MAG: succinate dehydrogenase, hydrophobic membrane anchor protein [Rickettsiales bacterium]